MLTVLRKLYADKVSFRTQEETLRLSIRASVFQSLFTMDPESVTLNHRAAVRRASAVWECAIWIVQHEVLGM
jgi:hypothetical protein